ncbi:MAG: STAS domain-containing protein [Gammaproteobacteria bacterium]
MTNPTTSPLVLDERCGISAVASLRDEIQRRLEASAECIIACDGVRAIDAATLQLLVVARRSAEKTDRMVRFERPSEEFLQAADYLGLRAQFD